MGSLRFNMLKPCWNHDHTMTATTVSSSKSTQLYIWEDTSWRQFMPIFHGNLGWFWFHIMISIHHKLMISNILSSQTWYPLYFALESGVCPRCPVRTGCPVQSLARRHKFSQKSWLGADSGKESSIGYIYEQSLNSWIPPFNAFFVFFGGASKIPPSTNYIFTNLHFIVHVVYIGWIGWAPHYHVR